MVTIHYVGGAVDGLHYDFPQLMMEVWQDCGHVEQDTSEVWALLKKGYEGSYEKLLCLRCAKQKGYAW